MTVKYEFENRKRLTFIQCSDENKIKIINAKIEKRCERMKQGARLWRRADIKIISLDGIYRTLNPIPTPNQIDWSQVPKEYKYLYMNIPGDLTLTARLPVEKTVMNGELCLTSCGHGELETINEGMYGAKRGTVDSIDSLLVRPIGE